MTFMLISILILNRSAGVWTGTVLFSLLILFLLCKSIGKDEFFNKIYPFCLTAFLIIMGTTQIGHINKLRYIPSYDLEAIYGGAIQWVETGSFAGYYDYFDWFPNNLGGLCFLYAVFKLFHVFTDDYFLIAALVNEGLLLATYSLVSLTAKKLWGSRYGILTLLLTGSMIPFLFMADVFYTDSLSMLFPILLYYIALKTDESEGFRRWGLCLLSGVTAAVGIWLKPTVLIMSAAISLTFLLRRKWKKAAAYMLSTGALYLLLTSALQYGIYHDHLSPELAEVKNTPYCHWIMMGLEEDGRYNPQDYEFTRSFSDPDERNAALKEEIRSRIREKGVAGMTGLYAAKLFRCFGDGTIGLSDFLDDYPVQESTLHSYLLYEGRNFGFYQSLCNIVLYALLLLMTVCQFMSVREEKRVREAVRGKELALSLSAGGLMVFLMWWETSPRYITNYLPVIIVLAAGGAMYLTAGIIEKGWDSRILSAAKKYSEEIRIFAAAAGFRTAIYLLSVCIMALMGDYAEGITFSDFLEAWKRWDSAHYINIAENGYAGAIENGEHIFLVFYPLYPWLMRLVYAIFGDFRLCGIFISVVSYALGSVFFYKITKREMGDETAENALIMISVFPFAFFFGSIATESLFFAVTAAFFYYLRKHNWSKVAFLGFLACLTKVQGLLLAFAVLVELFYFKRGFALIRKRDWKSLFRRIIYPGMVAATMLSGFVIYLLINFAVEGDPFKFMYYQSSHWGNGLCPIWKTFRYVKEYALDNWHTSTGMGLWLPELLLFILYLAAIIYGVRKKLRPMYMIYLIAFFLLTYSSTWLISAGRYTLSALPLFMLAGQWCREHQRWKLPLMLFSAMLMMIYMTGYYTWKQIM